MAVELNRLYNEIYSKYNVKLETSSCFNKTISWLHILENIDFAPFLHGGELIINSSLNEANDVERKEYIDKLLLYHAGGLIVSVQEHCRFSEELIDYCNQKQLPLITTSWETPFINLTRIFSEILIDKERADMDLISAFKNALHHPDDRESYLSRFEVNGFTPDNNYIVSILRCSSSDTSYFAESSKRIETILQNHIKKIVILKEPTQLIVLSCECSVNELKSIFITLSNRFSNYAFAIGSVENDLYSVFRSYRNAEHTIKMCGTILPENPLCYKDLGLYQILADMQNPMLICPPFVESTLGKLLEYDKKHHTKYMDVLRDYFKNDCSITLTAESTFYHQNTLKYKIKNIKEILGYDITTNENRLNIMLSLAILNVLEKRG